jgi:hypothetical protein
MWNAISNMIIKAVDNINRGVENATKAGDGNNGQTYQMETDTVDSNASSGGGGYTAPGAQDTSTAEAAGQNMGKIASMGKDLVSNIGGDKGKEGEEEEKKEEVASAVGGAVTSDERLKNIFGDNEDIIKVFAKIDAIQFTYKDKAHNIPDAENRGVDDDLHYGIKAQDLEKNPMTASAVVEDEMGNKLVDTKELTTINSAVISEICKRLEIIEKVLGIKVV